MSLAGYLTADDILNAPDSPVLAVDMTLFHWPGEVGVKSFNGQERREIERLANRVEAKQLTGVDMMAEVVAMSACDSEGKRIFSKEQSKKLLEKNSKALEHLYWAAMRHNGLTKDAAEDIEKN